MADDAELPPQPVWEGSYDEDGLPHGPGVMKYPPAPVPEDSDEEEKPGDMFEGNMQHGKRQGQGKYQWGQTGAVYQGMYVDGKKHGHGKMVFPDKSSYIGDWEDDKIQGSGRYQYSNGDLYQGQFTGGARHGQGSLHYAAVGCQLLGTWDSGHLVKGQWLLKDGTIFAGTFKDSRPVEGAYYFSGSQLLQPGCFRNVPKGASSSSKGSSGLSWQGLSQPQLGSVQQLTQMVQATQ